MVRTVDYQYDCNLVLLQLVKMGIFRGYSERGNA